MEIGKGKEGKEMDGKREKVMMEIKDHTKRKKNVEMEKKVEYGSVER